MSRGPAYSRHTRALRDNPNPASPCNRQSVVELLPARSTPYIIWQTPAHKPGARSWSRIRIVGLTISMDVYSSWPQGSLSTTGLLGRLCDPASRPALEAPVHLLRDAFSKQMVTVPPHAGSPNFFRQRVVHNTRPTLQVCAHASGCEVVSRVRATTL